jgi:hypothetical protein
MSNIQFIIDEEDIRFDTIETMSNRIVQRPVVLVIIVCMSTGKRRNVYATHV